MYTCSYTCSTQLRHSRRSCLFIQFGGLHHICLIMADADWENSENSIDQIFKNQHFRADCHLAIHELVSCKSQEFTLLEVQIQALSLFSLQETV